MRTARSPQGDAVGRTGAARRHGGLRLGRPHSTGPMAARPSARNHYSHNQYYPTFRYFLRDEVGPPAYVPEYGERFFWPVFLAGVP